MATRAEVTITGSTATLRQEGKTLTVRLLAPTEAIFAVQAARPPMDSFNGVNPGVSLFTIDVPSPANGEVNLNVELLPNTPS